MAAPAAAGQRIVLAAAGDLGFVDLDQAGERAAAGRHHAAAQLGTEQPRGLVGAEVELALQLQSRDAVGTSGHQIGRPEPGGQRQLGVVHDGPGGDRSLLAAASAFPGPRLGLQFPGFALAAVWADEALGPAGREQVSHAGRLIREALLPLDQGTGKIGHLGRPRSLCSYFRQCLRSRLINCRLSSYC